MTKPLPLPLALAAMLAFAGCATPATEAVGATADAPPLAAAPTPEATAPTAEEAAVTCQADKGQWAVGQIADEALVAKVQADTTSERVRVIKPGMMVTMDYREDRVNLEVDADNRVLVVRCS